jgi:hypothetical protein
MVLSVVDGDPEPIEDGIGLNREGKNKGKPPVCDRPFPLLGVVIG